MTNSKAYNVRLYCKLVNKDEDSDEAKEFLAKTILEQLNIIKSLREEQKQPAQEEQEEEADYSIMNSIFKKIN